MLTVLSVAPGLLIMVTSFTRFVIALSFLRSGLGLQSTPANLVLISLSLFMTFYVMSPTFDRAWQDGVRPLLDNKISEEEAYGKITEPFRTFMVGSGASQGPPVVRGSRRHAATAGQQACRATRAPVRPARRKPLRPRRSISAC